MKPKVFEPYFLGVQIGGVPCPPDCKNFDGCHRCDPECQTPEKVQ